MFGSTRHPAIDPGKLARARMAALMTGEEVFGCLVPDLTIT